MKTLTVTAARQNLGSWLKRTLKGEDIGVMIDGAIVAFRPVKVYSEDYAQLEYGVSDEELDRFADKMNKELDADRKAGRLKPFTGKLKRG
jgi:antitoxin (DNA-binding transcriptional repressor) of toxin-antitoxin stability system